MSDSFDEFFDDEQELAAQAEAGVEAEAEASTVTQAEKAPHAEAAAPAEASAARDAAVDDAAAPADAALADGAAAKKAGTGEIAPDAVPAGDAASASAPGAAAPAAPERKAPPFWMVLAIAGVSLALGVVLGYLAGTSATIAELEATAEQNASQGEATQDGSVSMPEGHPQVEVDEDGNAVVSEGGTTTTSDPLTLANNYFDMGMSAMASATDAEGQSQAAELFTQAIAHYDEYLAEHASASAEVDRAICVFYAGDHEGAIADLEAFTKRDATFAPAWANLGMFYESHGDESKAIDAYEKAIAAAEKDDTYGVKDYAQQHLDALKK